MPLRALGSPPLQPLQLAEGACWTLDMILLLPHDIACRPPRTVALCRVFVDPSAGYRTIPFAIISPLSFALTLPLFTGY